MNTKRRFTKVVIIALLLSTIFISGCVKKSLIEQISEPKSVVSAKSGDWPMFRHDAARTGAIDEVVEPPLELLWKYKIGDAVESSPAVSAGVVYVAVDNYTYALDAKDGSLKWKYKTGGIYYSSPAVWEGVVYVGSVDNYVYAADTDTGSLKWKYKTGSRGMALSSPVVSGAVVYVGSRDNYTYALDAKDGSLKWKYETGSEIYSSPAVSRGVVYVGSVDNYTYALDAKDGSLKWKYKTGAYILSSPAVFGGIVYVGSYDNYTYALDAKDGSLKWKYKTGSRGMALSSPAVFGGIVYVGSLDGYIYALDAKDGSLKWKYKTGGFVLSSPAVSSGAVYVSVVYVGSLDGYIYALDAKDGSLKWKYQIGRSRYSSPAISRGVVYVGSEDGYVYAFASASNSKDRGSSKKSFVEQISEPEVTEKPMSSEISLSNSGGGSWQHYKEITVRENSGSTLTDYQVLVQLSGGNFPTNVRTDGADIRFTDENGKELSYWLEEWDYSKKKARVWVKIPKILAGSVAITRMYYGNPSASSVSNGDATFEFFDDFTDGLGKWQTPTAGSLLIVNNAMHWEGNGVSSDILIKDEYNPNITDMAVESRTRYLSGSTNWIFWGTLGRRNNAAGTHYSADYYPVGQIGNRYQIRKYSHGTEYTGDLLYISADQWTNSKFVLYGNSLKFYDNDILRVSITDSSFTSGGTGVTAYAAGPGGWGVGKYEWDDIRVRKYAYPEPSVGVGTEVTVGRPGTYTDYYFGEAGPFYNLDIYVKWENAPVSAYIYPAFTFGFQAGGGYMGTQLVGNQKKAIFSIWDTSENSNTALPTGNCKRFGGEGTGAQCIIDYNWLEGREYRLRLWSLGTGYDGENWTASIYDTVTGVETTIGVIKLKDSSGYKGYGWLKNSAAIFLEYFGGANTCANQPYAKVTWRGPYANANSYTANRAKVPFYSSCWANNVLSTGRPLVTHEAGGMTQITTPAGTELWTKQPSGIVAEYHFDGNAQDSSGNGNHGTIYGATFVQGGVSGKALSFDGSNDYVEVADSAGLDLTNALTIEAWVKPMITLPDRYHAPIVGKGNYDTRNGYEMDYSTCGNGYAGPRFSFNFPPQSGGHGCTQGYYYPNKWYFVTTTFDGSKIRIYVNGTLDREWTASPTTANNYPLRMGYSSGSSFLREYFNGTIDEVRIYNRALSAEEIKADYSKYASKAWTKTSR